MPFKKKVVESGEKRSPDQDAAIEAAFLAGTLPEEDRRSEYEWLQRGDGEWVCYRDGQICPIHLIPEGETHP